VALGREVAREAFLRGPMPSPSAPADDDVGVVENQTTQYVTWFPAEADLYRHVEGRVRGQRHERVRQNAGIFRASMKRKSPLSPFNSRGDDVNRPRVHVSNIENAA
jgi:hypothetical protein